MGRGLRDPAGASKKKLQRNAGVVGLDAIAERARATVTIPYREQKCPFCVNGVLTVQWTGHTFVMMNSLARAHSASVAAQGSSIGTVTPAWLAEHLESPTLRVVDVRADARDLPNEGSGPRLRAASHVDVGPFAHRGGPAGWKTSKDKYTAGPGPSAAFRRGHIPGALALDVRAELFDDSGQLVSAPELALAMSGLGIGDGDTIVFVDEGRAEAALVGAWALARYGHTDVHVLEGGFMRWTAEGRQVSTAIVRRLPASFTARVLA